MKVAILMNVIPNYRRGFYERLLAQEGLVITVFCQDHLPGFNVELIHEEFGPSAVTVPFVGSEKSVAWQFLPVRRLWREFDVCVFYGNPRVLSSVLWATVLRLLGKAVIIWGQGHAYGANPLTESLRLAWWRGFDPIMVYTDREARVLQGRGFGGKHVVGLNNGLDQRQIESTASVWDAGRLSSWQREHDLYGRPVVLSVARLVAWKGFDLVVSALPGLLQRFPDLVWCVVGDGPARQNLEAHARSLEVSDHVRWLGAVYDQGELAPWFLSSRVLVHPGAIGLTLLHAFGYGVPVVTHNNAENHGPEIAAFEDGVTGLAFEEGDVASLGAAIGALLEDGHLCRKLGREALRVAQTQYNVDVMVRRFVETVGKARGPRSIRNGCRGRR